jgi:hypothetical protein
MFVKYVETFIKDSKAQLLNKKGGIPSFGFNHQTNRHMT